MTGDWISIHAPVKGATRSTCAGSSTGPHFNPRTREGCDTANIYDTITDKRISIHAPVKGATYHNMMLMICSH